MFYRKKPQPIPIAPKNQGKSHNFITQSTMKSKETPGKADSSSKLTYGFLVFINVSKPTSAPKFLSCPTLLVSTQKLFKFFI